jgi:hypothetical protein
MRSLAAIAVLSVACLFAAVSVSAGTAHELPPLFSAAHYATEFGTWLKAHPRVYHSGAERAHRFGVWMRNYDRIEVHNRNYRAGYATFTMAINRFGDFTREEYIAFVRRTGRSGSVANFNAARAHGHGHGHRSRHTTELPEVVDAPTAFDWRQKGAVLPIQDQDQCGSSPYFAAVDSIVGAWYQRTGLLNALSEQQVLDCSGPEGNAGCNGGEMTYSMQYVIDNKGICSWTSYPYTGVQGTCMASNCSNVAHITSYVSTYAYGRGCCPVRPSPRCSPD